jgi:V8-like Glu-specific endopeptidase
MRRSWTFHVVVLATVIIGLSLATARPAIAIISGHLDGTSHPNVGAVDIRAAGAPVVASGTLISPTVFLTAGHVTRFFDRAGQTRARVTFDPVVSESGTWYWGTVHTNPAYVGAQPANDPDDLGVIVFDAPIPGITPAPLPTENLLEQLGHGAFKSAGLTKVGYGTAAVLGGPNGGGTPTPQFSSGGTRKFISTEFVSLTGAWLKMDQLDGDVCYGDSGGPGFLGNTGTLVSITIRTANLEQCTNNASDLRIDTPAHRAFLGQYVTLP